MVKYIILDNFRSEISSINIKFSYYKPILLKLFYIIIEV